jgi:hypothetical protein
MASRKPRLDSLMVKSEAVLQKANNPGLSSSLMMLSTKYQSLQSSAKVRVARFAQSLFSLLIVLCFVSLAIGGCKFSLC